MKKILVIIIIAIFFTSCNKNLKATNNNYQIDVTISGVTDGTQAILKKQVNKVITNLDTAIINKGKFSFKGRIKEPIIFGIFIDSIKRGGIFPFVGINDHVIVEAYKDSLHKSKIMGSKLHDELTRLRKIREDLSKQTQKFLPEFQKANEEKDTAAINRINKEVKILSNKMAENDWKYVKSHPNSYVTPLVFSGVMTYPKYKDSIQIVFNSFSDKIKNANISLTIRNYFKFLDKQDKLK